MKEVRSRWLRWLALAGIVVAIGSGIYTLVSALTTPTVVQQVAPISRTAERIDRGLNGFEAAVDRAQARYRAVRERVAPERAGQAAAPPGASSPSVAAPSASPSTAIPMPRRTRAAC